MSILGPVKIAAAAIVKVASAIGIAVSAYHLIPTALRIWGTYIGAPGSAELYAEAAAYGIGFIAGIAGWHFADRLAGSVTVEASKERQQTELRRLESHHGVAL